LPVRRMRVPGRSQGTSSTYRRARYQTAHISDPSTSAQQSR